MAKGRKTKGDLPAAKYKSVAVSSLHQGRRGKHHDLVQGIVRQLNLLQSGSALEIPLATVGGIGLANLRSAVHRAAAAEGLAIETRANEDNFYVWKALNK